MMRPTRLDGEYIVRPVPEAELDRPDDVVGVVPRRNIFDVLNHGLFSNQFEEVV